MQMQMMHPMQPMQQMQPRLVLQQAVLKQPAVLSHARPAQPWLGQVHQLGQLNPARPMAMPVAMPVANAHREGRGQARGQAITMGLCCPYAAQPNQPRTHQSGGPPMPRACVDEGDGSRTEGASQGASQGASELPKELPKEAGCVGDAPSTFKFFGNLASSGFVKSQNDQNVNLFIFVPVGFASHAKQVVSMQVKPRRKELPLIEGQVPKDAGVEGMHPIDFKAFWEQSLFKFLSSI